MELAELLPPGVELDDDLVVWARRRAEDLLQGQDVDTVLVALGADASTSSARSSGAGASGAAAPVATAATPAPRARAMTPPPLPGSAGVAPRARAMTPMPPPPPRARAFTPVPPPPPSLVVTSGAEPPLERVATTLAMDDSTTVDALPRGADDDSNDVDDVELMEVDADELELVEDGSEQDEYTAAASDEDATGDDANARDGARGDDDEPNLFDDGEVTPGAALGDESLPDDQKTSLTLAPHLRQPSGPMAASEVREDTSRFALPEDAEDTAAVDSRRDTSAADDVGIDSGIDSGILDVASGQGSEDARPSSSSTAGMVLDDVDPSAFGLGFDAAPSSGSQPLDADAPPVRSGGTQRLTSVDAPIDDGLDDDDNDIDIDLD